MNEEALQDQASIAEEPLTQEPIAEQPAPAKPKNKVLAIVATLALYKSPFERVKDQVLEVAGQVGTGDDYFSLDTNPNNWDYDELTTVESVLASNSQKKALEGVQLANELLGFGDSVYDDMMNTTSLMGRQSTSNSKYTVSSTYHPDKGLEVKYTQN